MSGRIARGFTLIELMIVVAIIAILAAIALPAYQDYVIRSQVSEGAVLADGARVHVSESFSNTGRIPADNLTAGLPPTVTGKFVSDLKVADGEITVTFGSTAPQRANAALDNATLVFVPVLDVSKGSMVWTCQSAITPRYLPTICRTGSN